LRNHWYFAGLLLLGAAVYFAPLRTLSQLTSDSELYSHIPLIPLVSLFLIWSNRRQVFAETGRQVPVGAVIMAAGLAAYGIASAFQERLPTVAFRRDVLPNDYLFLCMAGMVAWVIGGFIAVYGAEAFRKARFALLFLVFAAPFPLVLINAVIKSLQLVSAEVSNAVFAALGVPYFRNGLVFQFSNVSVEVAEQCSGIRSSLSLFILSILAGHLFLRTFRSKLILAVVVFPITVFKNALRITTLTLLANYVDIRFLSSHWLHTSGGIPFFAVAMGLMIPIVWLLRRSEKTTAPKATQP
jgi:exosortase